MSCNNILTDDQVEAMFTATDDATGDATDWATDVIFFRKNQTQKQEVYQILLQQSCTQATPLWTSHQKREMSPLW